MKQRKDGDDDNSFVKAFCRARKDQNMNVGDREAWISMSTHASRQGTRWYICVHACEQMEITEKLISICNFNLKMKDVIVLEERKEEDNTEKTSFKTAVRRWDTEQLSWKAKILVKITTYRCCSLVPEILPGIDKYLAWNTCPHSDTWIYRQLLYFQRMIVKGD